MVVYHSVYTVICCRRLLCECLTASEVSQFRPFQLHVPPLQAAEDAMAIYRRQNSLLGQP